MARCVSVREDFRDRMEWTLRDREEHLKVTSHKLFRITVEYRIWEGFETHGPMQASTQA